MKLKEILLEHSKHLGIGRLELDGDGVCRLMVNQTLLITFESSLDNQGFYLYVPIGLSSLENEKEFSIKALEANLFGKETGRASFGYARSTHHFILFEYFEEAYLTFNDYIEKFEAFIRYAAYWVTQFQKGIPEEEISLKKHVQGLKHSREMKIFFA